MVTNKEVNCTKNIGIHDDKSTLMNDNKKPMAFMPHDPLIDKMVAFSELEIPEDDNEDC